MGRLGGLNPFEAVGAVTTALTAWSGRRDAKRRAAEREDKLDQTLPTKEWGVVRPDATVVTQGIESAEGRLQAGYSEVYRKPEEERGRLEQRRVDRQGKPNTLAQRVRDANETYIANPEAGFDPVVYAELVDWARENDRDLWRDLTGGEGQSVLMGFDPETGEARGADPGSLADEVIAANLEAETFPDMQDDPTTDDLQQSLKFDYQAAINQWQGRVDVAEDYDASLDELLGRDGLLQGDITDARDASLDATALIIPEMQRGIDEARVKNLEGRERLEDDFTEGLDRAEERRVRGLEEFTDDTAQRIEIQRLGLNDQYRSDIETMMTSMQAEGRSQRDIRAAVQAKGWDHREAISNISVTTNIEVARARSDLGLAYDGFTSAFDQAGLGELGAWERASVGAESGFAILTGQAAEATARYTQMVEQNTAVLRGQADFAYLNGMVTLGDMYKDLALTMPQLSEWQAASFDARLREDAIDMGYKELELGYTQMFADDMSAIGANMRQAEATEAAAEEAADAQGTAGLFGFGANLANTGVNLAGVLTA